MKLRRLAIGIASIFCLCTMAPAPAFAAEDVPAAQKSELTDEFNARMRSFNSWIDAALFWSVTGDVFNTPKVTVDGEVVIKPDGTPEIHEVGFPFIVFVLVAGGLFFTFYYRFINFRAFRHALDVVRGKYDNPDDPGEISHFQALTSALSATVGLGNIAGVAIAVQVGGPGAILWMMSAALFGMCLKFNSCTLAQLHRQTNPDGSVSGGPMYYLDIGLTKLGGAGSPLSMFGKGLAFMYALMLMGGSFGGGNMFQANQAFGALRATFPIQDAPLMSVGGLNISAADIFGILLAASVGLVILGGIQRIGKATSKIVPGMVVLYCLASLFIIFSNFSKIPECLGLIFTRAFTENAFYGGMVGVMVKGFQRAAFSNEAGIGSASIAHAAAKTDEPIREGMVAMMGPVIDTVIVCLMTGLVVTITGAWNDPDLLSQSGKISGVALTSHAFAKEISWFPVVLTLSVLLFAYSTMISWAYYGERGWIYVMDRFRAGAGVRTLLGYRLMFLLFVYVGTVTSLGPVLDFSDYMILCMALPNIVGSAFLAPAVARALKDYWDRYTSGTMQPYATKAVADPDK